MQGKGRMIDKNLDYYEGNFELGKKNGYGKFVWDNGD